MQSLFSNARTLRAEHRTGFSLAIVALFAVLQASVWASPDEGAVQGGRVLSAAELGELKQLPAGEQYRQLNLILMVSEGVEAGFLQRLGLSNAPESTLPQVRVDDFQTPLNRIVDQEAMLADAALLFRFALANEPAITRTLAELAAAHPQEVADVDLVVLAEDAIIIRTALSGSFEYLLDPEDPLIQDYLGAYQQRTVYLRNVMEYWSFEQELAAITDEAMAETGGKMDAYQRFLEDKPELDSFRKHLEAVEYIYWQSRGGKNKAPKLPGDELIDAESQVN